jgi:hypothetical protein
MGDVEVAFHSNAWSRCRAQQMLALPDDLRQGKKLSESALEKIEWRNAIRLLGPKTA